MPPHSVWFLSYRSLVSFVTVSPSIQLRLSFTWYRSRSTLKTCRIPANFFGRKGVRLLSGFVETLRSYPKMPVNLPKIYEDNPNVSEDVPKIFVLDPRISFDKFNLFSLENRRIFPGRPVIYGTFQSVIGLSTKNTFTYCIFSRRLSAVIRYGCSNPYFPARREKLVRRRESWQV